MAPRRVGKRTIKTTFEDRLLFNRPSITKGELIDYYEHIVPYQFPHVKNRLITMHRFPEGIWQEGFYHKDAPSYFPSWIKRKRLAKQEGGFVNYVVWSEPATMVYLAQYACITPHVWLSRVPKLKKPDRLIFDLDPSVKDIKKGFALVRRAARQLKTILEACGLTPFVMTTGSRGLHIVVPLDATADFDTVRAFARTLAEQLVAQDPKSFTLEVRKAKRRGRVFIDVLRNAYGQTGVAPYAVRAKRGAPVATPVTWQEVASASLTPTKYTIKNIFRRLSRTGDLWADIDAHTGSIDRAKGQLG